MKKYILKDEKWQFIYDYLKTLKNVRLVGTNWGRNFIEAVYYVMSTGCQWRMLPDYYGKWQTIYKRFSRWRDKGIWDGLFEKATEHADLQEVMLDGTTLRAHACAAGYEKDGNEEQGLGRSKGGFTSKIHMMVDALGNPLKFMITGGHRHDIVTAKELTQDIKNACVLADKAFDSDEFRDHLKERNCTAVIPPRKNRTEKIEYDKHIYKKRHLIECFFGKIKQFRRVFSRFDKAKKSFQAFIDFASTLVAIA